MVNRGPNRIHMVNNNTEIGCSVQIMIVWAQRVQRKHPHTIIWPQPARTVDTRPDSSDQEMVHCRLRSVTGPYPQVWRVVHCVRRLWSSRLQRVVIWVTPDFLSASAWLAILLGSLPAAVCFCFAELLLEVVVVFPFTHFWVKVWRLVKMSE